MAYHPPGGFVQLLSPQGFSKAKFAETLGAGKEVHPSALTLLKGSPLNIRLGGPGDGGLGKAMLMMLPKPKLKPPSSPFEEAQW